MSTLTLTKEIRENGDIFYCCYCDNRFISGSVIYAGNNYNTSVMDAEYLQKAKEMFQKIKSNMVIPQKIIIESVDLL